MKRPLTDSLCVRPAREADINRVCNIAREAWVSVHESIRKILGEELHSVLCANWADEKEAAIRRFWNEHPDWVWVVESKRKMTKDDEKEIVAFITFRIDDSKRLGTICNNAVDPAAQGSGIGTLMYKYVLDLFRERGLKYACVHTGLDEGHAPARRAYEKAGFDIARPDVTYFKYL